MKIAIKLESGFYAVAAEPVTVCGVDLALHKTIGKTGWSITHPRTGFALATGRATKETARSETAVKLQAYGVEKALALLDKYPSTPAVETLPEKQPAVKVDVDHIAALIAKAVGGLTERETAAVRRALNSRTGQLKAKAPSAFGDADERLAAAAWQGIQPNGYKVGIVSVFSLRGEARDLYEKLSKFQFPAALDKDKLVLVKAGVW